MGRWLTKSKVVKKEALGLSKHPGLRTPHQKGYRNLPTAGRDGSMAPVPFRSTRVSRCDQCSRVMPCVNSLRDTWWGQIAPGISPVLEIKRTETTANQLVTDTVGMSW